ncbi:MAG: hypothetical protein INR72_12090, partial [Williamsia herbipolensis]|nr:hypothetical protein [Williamsia herbipolensis]
DRVSDGNVLLAVDGAGGARPTVRAGARDVSAVFRHRGTRWIGLVDGLAVGRTAVTATAAGTQHRQARITVTNFPRTGPMFSGPQEQPFVCRTTVFTTLAGSTLGAPSDAACTVPTKVEYVYRSTTDRSLKPLADRRSRPADLATTTTSTGRTVPYVVRVESGVINRSIYEFAVLDDGSHPISPTSGPTAWNGRMLYTFGGGCPGGWYTQGSGTGGIGDDWMLGQGYAVVSSSLNVFGNNCQPVTAAETMAMTKEHVVETIGVPASTIGIGCSGGSYQVFAIGDNYPGLLDGILAGCVFPEVDFATLHTITDARLLQVFFAAHSEYTDAQQRAISGFARSGTVANLGEGGRRIDPRVYCPAELPVAQRYDPVGNPTGARCDVYSHQRNIFGTLPGSNGTLPLRPLDNVGIQYGLGALNSGAITVDQFLQLNGSIGGFDRDANVVRQRTVADRAAIATAYRTGQLVNGRRLGSVPIIELREYTDDLPNGDIHLRFHSFSFRQRLVDANGDSGNHVMWTQPRDVGGFSTANAQFRAAISELDAWTARIDRLDPTSGTDLPSHRLVVRTKSRSVTDACFTPHGTKIVERQVPGIDNTRCNTLYPVWPSPRMVAGGTTANDIIACTTKRLDRRDYRVAFTDAQWRSLQQVFPGGVCNWQRPGVGQTGAVPAPWPTFTG